MAFRIVPRLTARGVPSLGEEALRSVHDAEAGEAVRGIRTPCVPSDGWPKRSRGTGVARNGGFPGRKCQSAANIRTHHSISLAVGFDW